MMNTMIFWGMVHPKNPPGDDPIRTLPAGKAHEGIRLKPLLNPAFSNNTSIQSMPSKPGVKSPGRGQMAAAGMHYI
jgi:hypothetical protein